jgi:hypothetical protein
VSRNGDENNKLAAAEDAFMALLEPAEVSASIEDDKYCDDDEDDNDDDADCNPELKFKVEIGVTEEEEGALVDGVEVLEFEDAVLEKMEFLGSGDDD